MESEEEGWEEYLEWKKGKCVYKCELCLTEVVGSEDFWKHVSLRHHEARPRDYLEHFKHPLFVSVYLSCQICPGNLQLLHDYRAIKRHLAGYHENLEPFDYFKSYIFKTSKSLKR